MTSVDSNFKQSLESPTYTKSSYHAPHYTSSVESARTALSAGSNEVLVGEQWLVLGRIGEGSFGEVFEARDIDTNRAYAVKREPKGMRHPQLKHESIMYDALVGGPGIPACHWYGEHEDFNCIVIDLLGPSLKMLRQAVSDISLDIALNVACQLINTMEHIHKRGIIYRDVKPDNFLFPANFHLPDPDCYETQTDNGFMVYETAHPSCKALFEEQDPSALKLHAIDFGLASWWRNPSTNKPYPEGKRKIRNKTGTARYASLNVHRGREHARRDDMESVGYLLIDLALGSLPWTGIQARNSRLGWDKMREAKSNIILQDLCAGLPKAYLRYIEYTRALKFEDEPDYAYLRTLFQGATDAGPYSEIVVSFDKSYQRDPEVKILSTVSDQSTFRKEEQQDNKHDQDRTWTAKDGEKVTPHNSRENDGIFTMDDIPNGAEKSHEINREKSEKQVNGQKNGRQRSRELSNTSPSGHKRYFKQSREKRSNVGWNTHRRLQQPWEPKIDWETIPSAEKTSASWGEDRPNGMWSKASTENRPDWAAKDAINESWALKNDGWGDSTIWDGGQQINVIDNKKSNGQNFQTAVSVQSWFPTAKFSEPDVLELTSDMAFVTLNQKNDGSTSDKAKAGKRGRHPTSKPGQQRRRSNDDKRFGYPEKGGNDVQKHTKSQTSQRRNGVWVSGGSATTTMKNVGDNVISDINQQHEWQRVGSTKSDRKPFKPKSYKQTGGYGRNSQQKGSNTIHPSK